MWMDKEHSILSDPVVGRTNQNFECPGGTGGAQVGTSGPSKNPRRFHRSPAPAREAESHAVFESIFSEGAR